MSERRGLRAALILLLVLTLGGGASSACLAVDLCGIVGSADESGAPSERDRATSCHASDAAGSSVQPSEHRLSQAAGDDCCSPSLERPAAKLEPRERRTVASHAGLSADPHEREIAELVIERAVHTTVAGPRPGPRRPVFVLHASLLI